MFVVLFVPMDDVVDGWSQCCGPNAYMVLSECFKASDCMPDQTPKEFPTTPEGFDEYDKKSRAVEVFYFPKSDDSSIKGYERYLSQEALSIVTIGTTGWSGYSDENGYWSCGFNDLTLQGKELYSLLWRLHGIKPHILTFLDT